MGIANPAFGLDPRAQVRFFVDNGVSTCRADTCSTIVYQAWGHSTIVSPNGEVLATTEHQPGIVYADLDLAEVAERRQNMPLTQQKRHDLYELVDKTA